MPERPGTAPTMWRVVRCRRCHTQVQVMELPERFIDPARFLCGKCARVRA